MTEALIRCLRDFGCVTEDAIIVSSSFFLFFSFSNSWRKQPEPLKQWCCEHFFKGKWREKGEDAEVEHEKNALATGIPPFLFTLLFFFFRAAEQPYAGTAAGLGRFVLKSVK